MKYVVKTLNSIQQNKLNENKIINPEKNGSIMYNKSQNFRIIFTKVFIFITYLKLLLHSAKRPHSITFDIIYQMSDISSKAAYSILKIYYIKLIQTFDSTIPDY